jgi:hypothetical protein
MMCAQLARRTDVRIATGRTNRVTGHIRSTGLSNTLKPALLAPEPQPQVQASVFEVSRLKCGPVTFWVPRCTRPTA